jgi:dynein light chain roadblock-type
MYNFILDKFVYGEIRRFDRILIDNGGFIENYAALVSQLAFKASGMVRTLDDSDELAFLRVRSKKHEIMIAPDKDYCLVVVQNPQDERFV